MKVSLLERLKPSVITSDDWTTFYPRRIVCPNGYFDPIYWSIINKCQHDDGLPAKEEIGIVKSLRLASVPTYFLSHDFMQAVISTEPVDNPSLRDLNLPLEEMLIVLPVEVSTQHFGWPMAFLSYALADSIRQADNVIIPKGILLYEITLIPSDGRPLSYYGRVPMDQPDPMKDFSGYEYTDRTKMEEAYLKAKGVNAIFHEPGTKLPNEQEDRQLPTKAFYFLYRLFQVLQAVPHYIEPKQSHPTRPPSVKKGRVKDALWNPTWIGKQYIPLKVSNGGTHSSPRLHWRRGHTRRQHFGPNNSQVKQIWIQPTLVGSE